MKNKNKITEMNSMETLEHQESIDELLKENNIDPDDVEDVYSGVSVNITIIYKKGN